MDKDITADKMRSYEDKVDKRTSMFIVLYYFIEALNLTIKNIIPMSDVVWKSMSNGFLGLLFIMMLLTIGPVLKRVIKPFLITEFVFLSLYCISFLQGNAEQLLLLKTGFRTLGVCIPLAFYVYSIKNKAIFYNTVLKATFLLIAMLSLVFFLNLGKNSNSSYNMAFSYALLLPTLFQLNEFFKTKRFINLSIGSFAVILIVFYGARGPLLCIVFMILVKYLFEANGIVSRLLGGLAIVTLVTCSKQIASLIVNTISSHGISSRTLNKILSGTLFDSSGRDILFSYYWELIQEKPFLGWGLQGGWIKAGSGPHNTLLVFLLAFGIIGGGILCVFAIGLNFRILTAKNSSLKELLIIYCAINIVMFLASGSVWEKVDWFIFVALCFSPDNKKTEDKLHHLEGKQIPAAGAVL